MSRITDLLARAYRHIKRLVPRSPRRSEAHKTATMICQNAAATRVVQAFPLFKLPGEIRNQIYRRLLTEDYPLNIHTRNSYVTDIMMARRTWTPDEHACRYSHMRTAGAPIDLFCLDWTPWKNILLTCHQIHLEAASILYIENTITFSSITCCAVFLRAIGFARRHMTDITVPLFDWQNDDYHDFGELRVDKVEMFALLQGSPGLRRLACNGTDIVHSVFWDDEVDERAVVEEVAEAMLLWTRVDGNLKILKRAEGLSREVTWYLNLLYGVLERRIGEVHE